MLKDIPEIYRRTVKLPSSYCKTPADAARNPEDVLDYIPCEVWPEVFRYTNQAALPGVTRLASKLVEREVRAYRSGVYTQRERGEPATAEYLPPASVVRGLLDCCRRQISHPSFDFPDAVLLAMLRALASPPRPLPPLELSWLSSALPRGGEWRRAAYRVAARAHGPSARRMLEGYLKEVEEGKVEEAEIIDVFELLPVLCRNIPPNSLRGPVETCLHQSYQDTLKYKQKPAKKQPNNDTTQLLFVKQMELIKACLECDKIHEANRTLLSQILENYFNIIEDDNVAWPAYEAACCALSTKYLERMTSPSSWWEVSPSLLRRAAAVRARLAGGGLAWLNDIIDAQAGQITEQEYSLRCMAPALRARVDGAGARDWLLGLMARAQVVCNESEEDAPKLYMCDVFALSVVSLSGLWSCEPDADAARRRDRLQLVPAPSRSSAHAPSGGTVHSRYRYSVRAERAVVLRAGCRRGAPQGPPPTGAGRRRAALRTRRVAGQYTAGTDIVFALSGLWSCEPDADAARRRDRLQLVPAAVAQLCARPSADSTQQVQI
ncbi:hypothetical protein MSG28_008958 [Choristoneura fumiferana]|uniref:Uncharacterized protein n=1 Tax=Choristoneura fumiferana TaxID=7141 RepID=A0ACC0J8M8_CHOFU|nr:hypothetical protein MSG28_008958 [Choristoneura fumiferana]